MIATARRIGWFVAVGCAAAAVHLGVVVVLVSRVGWPPLGANVLGWLVAFCVSFSGHWHLTFPSSGAPFARAAGRFLIVSLTGFVANESLYALLLRLTSIRYDVVLFFVLLAVAVMTYLLSSRWAFRGTGPA
jgi:putative flippase GtrA